MADPIKVLVQQLAKLPGIGEKTATRLAFHIIRSPEEYAVALADAIRGVRREVRLCSVCCSLTTDDPCAFCADARRDRETVCVVAHPPELIAIERTGAYRGRYHVLHGVLAPLEGLGPEDLRITELLRRLAGGEIREIILALSSTVEGEATALYLTKVLRPLGVRVTRIASGVPIGGELEYTDPATISRALEGRREA
ncbi:MAG TPA: recombination mediator RecR [Polyangia bacterium]